MTFTTVRPDIAEYVVLCEEHLRDLPPAVVAQLRLDIEEIVAEVCRELDGAPRELVGPPLRLVTELRTAAGFSPPPAAARNADAAARRGIAERARSLWEHAAARWVRHLLADLRPAWWVGRGFVLAVAAARLTGAPRRPSWLLGLVPYWPVLGSGFLGLVAIAGAVYLSVEAGRRRLSRPQRALRLLSSIVAIWFGFVLVTEVKDMGRALDPSHFLHHPGPTPPAATMGGVGQAALVEVGSDLTGDRVPVLELQEAREVVESLLTHSPPAAIFIRHAGAQSHPGTRAAIDAALDDLTAQGLLNG